LRAIPVGKACDLAPKVGVGEPSSNDIEQMASISPEVE